MKTLKHIIFLVVIISTSITAQNTNKGLYLSAEDYKKNVLSFSSEKTKIKPHTFFKRDVIRVKYNDSLYTFFKKDVFGYVDKDGIYRLEDGKIYTIINPGEEIVIYKTVSGTGLKNSPIVESYFFSKNAKESVQPLTLRNVVRTFRNDQSFSKIIELCITNDEDLLKFDAVHNEYRINRLLVLART